VFKMKKTIIVFIFIILILGVFITANLTANPREKGITIFEIRDKILEEKLDCSKGCDFEIVKEDNKYEIKSIVNIRTKEVLYSKGTTTLFKG